jgi:hypothetical protein
VEGEAVNAPPKKALQLEKGKATFRAAKDQLARVKARPDYPTLSSEHNADLRMRDVTAILEGLLYWLPHELGIELDDRA